VLGVVPQRRHRVAVVVVHDGLGVAGSAERRGAGTGANALHELIHLPAVERLLLVGVVVILVAGQLTAGVAGQAGGV
jgi:hypothetical protein